MGWLLLCLHLLLFHFPSFSSSFNFLCHPDESSALLQFKSSFTINSSYACDEPLKAATWKNGTDCCSWLGVTCDTISGHVIGLNVSCDGLQGILHPNNTLFRLTHLQTLNLSFNDFSQSQLPSQFGGFVSLTHLDLSLCYLEGEIPPQISHLSKLASLDLSLNYELVWKETTLKRLVQNATILRALFSDYTDMSSIRPDFMYSMLNLSSSLVTLSLRQTRLVGNLKNNILCLPGLQELYMSGNFDLQGQLPELSCSASLSILGLSSCQFQGPIPLSFFNLTHLTSLSLSGNHLNVSIPSSLLTLPRLTSLYLSNNGLSGQIPNVFHQSNRFQELDLSGNNIVGELPSSLSNLQNLIHLDLSRNQLNGLNPSSLSHLQHLIHLDLSSNRLSGVIPSSLSHLQHLIHLDLSSNRLSGLIPSSLLHLQNLTYLDLSSNRLSGLIPSSLSHLQNLSHFDLSSNAFSGQIPDVFGGLTKLKELHLNINNLEGEIPSSLFNLSQLFYLDCSHNKLEGPLPNKITGFRNLTYLILNNNLLNGTIPSWYLSLPSLVELDISNNQFAGHISAVSSYSLEHLYLCSNKLQGNIPESIFNLANLTILCLSSNNLSGLVNFQLFSKLQNLDVLSLSQNCQLSLNFESNVNYNFSHLTALELSSISLTEIPNLAGKLPCLSYLDLSNNKLYGRVPNWFLEMDSLQFLNLSQNLFMSIDQLPRNYRLSSVDLSSNFLAGDISLSICNTSSLVMLNLAHNKLTGFIPQCLANLSSLRVLDLHMNKLYGPLPSIFSKDSELRTLNLNGNQLEGLLPKSLSNCTYLEVLNLGNNQIEDTFPHWLQTLQNLTVLALQGNKLHGPIASLKIRHPFPSLIIFDISCNNFSGPLPKAYLKNFEAMKNVIQVEEDSSLQYMEKILGMNADRSNIKMFFDSVTVTIKGINITLVKIPKIFVNIDLSKNKFEGEIPNVIGELHALKGLNLSHNRLTGPIPQSMGNLTNLESLDLSSNMLTGGIPAELTNLNFLEVLDLSHNHLVGEIPQGKQFNTFSNDSYGGNLGLCGFPLSMKCKAERHCPPSPIFWSEEKFGFGWKPVAIGYGCGMVFGVGMGCCVLLIGKPQWLVRMVGGQPNKRVKRRTRARRTRG